MQAMYERLMRAIGRPELIDDPRFVTNTDRLANNHVLDPIVADFMAARTQEECLSIFEAADVTVGAVADIAELMAHPYIRDRGSLVTVPDREAGELPMHAPIPRLSGSPARMRNEAPSLGQHNAGIFGALGISAEELKQLSEEGVI